MQHQFTFSSVAAGTALRLPNRISTNYKSGTNTGFADAMDYNLIVSEQLTTGTKDPMGLIVFVALLLLPVLTLVKLAGYR